MLSDLSICRALIARKTPIILAEGGQTLLNPCIRCDVYSQSRHSSRQQGSMRGVFFCVQKRLVIGKNGTFQINPNFNIHTDFDRFEDACIQLKTEENPDMRHSL